MRAVDGSKKDTKDRDGKAVRGEAAKAKRPRKRAPLAAVPDVDAQAGKKPKAPRAIRGELPQASPRPVVSPAPVPKRAPAQRGAPAASKGKKRELPPYLRIVK